MPRVAPEWTTLPVAVYVEPWGATLSALPDCTFSRSLNRPDLVGARLLVAARVYPSLDLAALAAWLDTYATPTLQLLEPRTPTAVERVALAMFDAGLDVVGRGLTGVEHGVLSAAWLRVLPACVHLLPTGTDLPSALSNAAYNLLSEPNTRGDTWVDRLVAAAPLCQSPSDLRGAALLLAWRAGLAHYRAAARRTFVGLPSPLAAHLVGEPTLSPDEQATLFDNPWIPPSKRHLERRLTLVGRIGGLRGFGGSFVTPPVLGRATADTDDTRFLAWDDEGAVLLHTDCYGNTARRVDAPHEPGDSALHPAFKLDNNGSVTHTPEGGPSETRAFPVLAGWRSAVSDATTLLVTLPHSHHVYVIARAPVTRPEPAA